MLRAGAGNSTGKNLAPIGNKTTQEVRILVIRYDILGTESADLLLEEGLSPAAKGAGISPPVLPLASAGVTSGISVIVSAISTVVTAVLFCHSILLSLYLLVLEWYVVLEVFGSREIVGAVVSTVLRL